MWETEIDMNDISRVYRLNEALANYDFDIDLMSTNRHYVVDAKSLMGVLSLDLTKTIILRVHTDDEKKIKHLKNTLRFIK